MSTNEIKRISDESFNKATRFYVALARDASDFVDMVNEEKDEEVLQALYLLFTTPNPKMNKDNLELNEIGASILKKVMDKRNIELPPIPQPETK